MSNIENSEQRRDHKKTGRGKKQENKNRKKQELRVIVYMKGFDLVIKQLMMEEEINGVVGEL